jgi:hypothetical protein
MVYQTIVSRLRAVFLHSGDYILSDILVVITVLCRIEIYSLGLSPSSMTTPVCFNHSVSISRIC